jgi:hypothetical protein
VSKEYLWEFYSDDFSSVRQLIEEFENMWKVDGFNLVRTYRGYEIVKVAGNLERRVFKVIIFIMVRTANLALRLTPHEDDIDGFADSTDEARIIKACEEFVKAVTPGKK